MDEFNRITRREFLGKSLQLGAGAALLPGLSRYDKILSPAQDQKLGRICIGNEGARFDIKSKPSINGANVGLVYHDDVIPWYRTVAASTMDLNNINQRWVETEGGYINAGYVQPVRNILNTPADTLPTYGNHPGVWVEITVPVADLIMEGAPGSYWAQHTIRPRAYYGQVFWAEKTGVDENNQIRYLLTQRYGAASEFYWVPGSACKILTPDDISPISPEVEDKQVIVNLARQTLSCMEAGREVFFCRVSTGPLLSDGWQTPPGTHAIWRKLVSLHMSAGGDTGEAFDTPGIGWTTLFTTTGAAVHSAYWHNEFGFARSHGCVNCLPEDAKYVWRWTTPVVDYEPGDLTWKDWTRGFTPINVVES